MSTTDQILDSFEFEDDGAQDRMIVARVFSNDAQANIYASGLRDAGILCFLTDEMTQAALIGFGNTAGVRLHIHERDIEAARQVLDEFDSRDFGGALVQEVNDDSEISSRSIVLASIVVLGICILAGYFLYMQYVSFSS